MRILALVTDAFGGRGGISEYNRYLLKALSGDAIGAEVIVLPRLKEVCSEKCPERVFQLKSEQNRLLYTIKAMKTICQQGPFDIVFCGHPFMAPLGLMAARLAGASFWLQAHGRDVFNEPSRMRKRALEKADLLTCVSEYSRGSILSWSDISSDKVKVLYDTIDLSRFYPGPKPESLIERLGLSGKKVLLSVGRLCSDATYKGIDKVIDLLPCLLTEEPDLEYLVVGKKGDDVPRLEKLAQNKGLASKVHFAGPVTEEELVEVYRMADWFALPSTKEGFGIVFLEAAATGLPVLGGDSDGSREALMEGKIGIMVNVEEREDLLKGMKELIKREKHIPEEIKQFSFPNFERKLKNILDDFLSEKRG
ncbi:MAG: glycosyltransferase [Candidatus Omnitrophica bacterium]|nr:glycosyltransferase [Candidatus Omnitrophota bacterium]